MVHKIKTLVENSELAKYLDVKTPYILFDGKKEDFEENFAEDELGGLGEWGETPFEIAKSLKQLEKAFKKTKVIKTSPLIKFKSTTPRYHERAYNYYIGYDGLIKINEKTQKVYYLKSKL